MTRKINVCNQLLFDALAQHGFKRDGVFYFRRQQGAAHQALYLQSSRYGDVMFPEMMITFNDLNSARPNKLASAHLRSRLSNYYHPLGDPSKNVHWSLPLKDEVHSERNFELEITQAVVVALNWFAEYPTWQVAAQKMERVKSALLVTAYELFNDLGKPVPMPSED